MSTTDLHINSKIRAVLARHWVDAEKLQFLTAAGTVRFHGVLARQGCAAVCDVETSLMEVLIGEIRRISGVRKVYFTGVTIEQQRDLGIGAPEAPEVDSFKGTRQRKPESPEEDPARALADKRRSRSQRREPLRFED